MNNLIQSILTGLWKDNENGGVIFFIMSVILVMSLYEFIVYKIVSRRSMYNKAFHISIMIMPFFIGAIIYALQSNIAITLGTIGALAIIRYRTAVKDPIDMIYILWSVFIGISCGCQLYKLCIITSIIVTIILLFINVVSGRLLTNPLILIVNSDEDIENDLVETIKKYSKHYKIKSRNFTENGTDYIFQIDTTKGQSLTTDLKSISKIKRFSLLEYDNEDSI